MSRTVHGGNDRHAGGYRHRRGRASCSEILPIGSDKATTGRSGCFWTAALFDPRLADLRKTGNAATRDEITQLLRAAGWPAAQARQRGAPDDHALRHRDPGDLRPAGLDTRASSTMPLAGRAAARAALAPARKRGRPRRSDHHRHAGQLPWLTW